jgi:hypothetical protein
MVHACACHLRAKVLQLLRMKEKVWRDCWVRARAGAAMRGGTGRQQRRTACLGLQAQMGLP